MAVVLLALALPLTALANTYATVIATDVLYLRAEPRTDAEILGRFRHGTKVEILNSTKYRNWAKVRAGGKVGYMYKKYLSAFTTTGSSSGSNSGSSSSSGSSSGSSASKSGSQVSAGTIRYITSSNGGPVNLRRRASTKTSLMARMPVGSKVTVLSSGSVWTRVLYNGKDGWVMTKFLKSR